MGNLLDALTAPEPKGEVSPKSHVAGLLRSADEETRAVVLTALATKETEHATLARRLETHLGWAVKADQIRRYRECM